MYHVELFLDKAHLEAVHLDGLALDNPAGHLGVIRGMEDRGSFNRHRIISFRTV